MPFVSFPAEVLLQGFLKTESKRWKLAVVHQMEGSIKIT
jgi:hypothetical protein